jgi:broad specificity phosphatase PhoE
VTYPSLLVLVRHGESAWIAERRFQGRGDPPLSDAGLRQAAAVGARLAAPAEPPAVPVPDTTPLAIWHSPLRRAAQTAQAIHEAREADAPLRPLDSLTELAQGEWEGLTHEVVQERYPDQLAAWRADPVANVAPGGESVGDALVRAESARLAIVGGVTGSAGTADSPTPPPAEPVLGYEQRYGRIRGPRWSIVVAHDGILRLMMLSMLGIDIARFWSFPLALASITVLDMAAGVVRLRAHNLDEHIVALTRR